MDGGSREVGLSSEIGRNAPIRLHRSDDDPRARSSARISVDESSETVELKFEEDGAILGVLVDENGEVVSHRPPAAATSGPAPYSPGSSTRRPVVFWLDRCGVQAGAPVESGTYDGRLAIFVSFGDEPQRSGYRLSTESVPIEITDPT
jgi:hypothetical protein